MCACRHVSGACVSSEGERLQFDRGTKGGGERAALQESVNTDLSGNALSL